MSLPVLVFDIESIPDVAGLRALRGHGPDRSDEEIYALWCQERQANGQSDFMPLHLQRVLVISCVFRNAEGLRVHSFVDRDNASEGRVIQN
ncbi:MAG: 3'-5' exonuclease, partial [Ramlibacter sp.]|nr:3'-5' exonuclease [Ramlibacter sp.]